MLVALVLVLTAILLPGPAPVMTARPAGAQGTDVFLNVTGGGTKKLNIAIPDFTVVTGADTAGSGKQLAAVTAPRETLASACADTDKDGRIVASSRELPAMTMKIAGKVAV